ncbi:MAG: DoxX family protein [Gimesia sp.]
MTALPQKYCVLFLRIALGVTYLSAVADRLGLWGDPGAANVAWGNFHFFLEYTALLNPYCPSSMIPVIGWGVTIIEVLLGIVLIVGFQVRISAVISGILLLCFAVGMIVGIGIKAPLDYSVFTASAASFLLAFQENHLSVETFRNRNKIPENQS